MCTLTTFMLLFVVAIAMGAFTTTVIVTFEDEGDSDEH